MDFDNDSSKDNEIIEEEFAEEIEDQFVDGTPDMNVESPTESVKKPQTEKDAEKNESTSPTALTMENLKRHEQKTNPLQMEELISKKQTESSEEIVTDEAQTQSVVNQEQQESIVIPSSSDGLTPRPRIEPSKKVITKGLKLTGEEYVAISIDVQTEESWLMQSHTGENQFNLAAAQLSQASTPRSRISDKLHRAHGLESAAGPTKHMISDVSASEIIESSDEAKQHEIPEILAKLTPRIVDDESTSTSDFEFADDFPVMEMTIPDTSAFDSEDTSYESNNLVMTVLPPSLLQYKRESEETDVDFDNLKPPLVDPSYMTMDDLADDEQEYYDEIIQEEKKRRKKRARDKSQLININPHDAFSTKQEKREEKEKAVAKKKAKEVEKKKQMDAQTAANQANFYSFARQFKTINYALSSEKCMDEGWTLKPESPEPPLEPAKEFFVQEPGTDIMSGKRYKRTFVQKYYDNGKPFLSVFSDGSGTVWYPSGNVAVSIVSTEKQGKLIYIIHEDKELDENPHIQAVFGPDGNCTCYYSDGTIRTNLDPFGGEYYSLRGERLKRWQWRDRETHVHAPPFQPITFGLNKRVGVRIIAQENIYVTFTGGRRGVRFNVGTKLRVKSGSPIKDDTIDLNSLLLQDRILYVQSLLQRFYQTFQFPHSPRRAQLKLPHFITAKMEKIAKLRSSVEKLPPIKERTKHSSKKSSSSSKTHDPLPHIQNNRSRKSHIRVQEAVRKKPESQFVVTVN